MAAKRRGIHDRAHAALALAMVLIVSPGWLRAADDAAPPCPRVRWSGSARMTFGCAIRSRRSLFRPMAG